MRRRREHARGEQRYRDKGADTHMYFPPGRSVSGRFRLRLVDIVLPELDAQTMPISIEPLTPVFGATLTGFSIRHGILHDVIAEIDQNALDEYSILLLPDQPVDDNEQVAFTERFGPLEETLPGAVGAVPKSRVCRTICLTAGEGPGWPIRPIHPGQ